MTDERGDLVSLDEAKGQAGGEADVRGRTVFGGDGSLLGEVADVLVDRTSGEPRYLAVALEASVARQKGGKRVFVPFSAARVDGRSVYLDAVTGLAAPDLPTVPTDAPLPTRAAGFGAALDATKTIADRPLERTAGDVGVAGGAGELREAGEARMTVSEEELLLEKRVVPAGEVRIEKHIETERVREVVPVMREDVTVERRPLPPGAGLEPRTEDGVIYVPIVEEELVITKRLVAREELVIRKTQVTEEQVVEETLRRERAEVVEESQRAEPGGSHDPPG